MPSASRCWPSASPPPRWRIGWRRAAALTEADLNLAAARADLRLRSLDHLLLSTQFRLLGGETATPPA